MRKLLVCAIAAFAALSMTAALADGLCSVTVTATCTTVTFQIHVPKGEGGSTAGTATADGIAQDFAFEGVDHTVTIADEGAKSVAWIADGDVTTGEKTKHFHFEGTAERSGEGCAVQTTPPPSTTPPPTQPPTHHAPPPTPPLAMTGLGLTVGAVGFLGLLTLGAWLLRFGYRRRSA